MSPWLVMAAACVTAAAQPVEFHRGDLRVSDNRRFLVYADGTPFFYLGDTAWELFHRLNREEAERYLDDRRRKGFTVIQAVVLAELDGLGTPNPYGALPLKNADPTQPQESYFQHVDWIVRKAQEKGLIIGMLPTWGNKVTKGSWEKTAPIIFNPANAYEYGVWIGRRYRDAPNLIWILGGDRSPEGVIEVWRAMARGIRQGDAGRHLMTYHPQGRASSAEFLHEESWLDFNMLQSGHNLRDNRNDEMVARDYARLPVKPCMDGEPRYENHPIDWKPEEKGWFDDADVRQAAYWALFAGAHGHTYGCHDVWQMRTAGRDPVGFARGTWERSLDLPGATQMGHVRKLMESRPMLSRVPDQSLVAGAPVPGLRATRGDGYAFVYLPQGGYVSVRLGTITGAMVRATWFDPRTGQSRVQGQHRNQGTAKFKAPTSGRGNDWVLVLDSTDRRFPLP